MPSIDIRNKTVLRKADLRRFIAAAMKAEGVENRRYTVEVYYSKGGSTGGYGYYNWPHVKIGIPKEWALAGLSPWEIAEAARVLVHEIGHTLGLKHKDMLPLRDLDVSWSEGMELRPVLARKPKGNVVERRAEHAKAMLAKWEKEIENRERSVKRAKNTAKKWRAKVRYYEKRGAA